MLLRRVKIQIALFFVIAVVGVGYAGWQYAGLDRLFGDSGYLVTLELPRGGGLFEGSDVTYRGVTVGRVTQVRLDQTGVEAVLDIEPDAEPIPTATRAVVTNRSAIGEQYVDLRPDGTDGPYLEQGSRIPAHRTELPLPPEKLLADADALLTSIPTGSLRTVVHELNLAFAGNGPRLERILDATNSLTRAAHHHLPQTRQLLSNSRTVLHTQAELGESITTFSSDLRSLSAQLKTSDPDIRKLINVGPRLSDEVTTVLSESGSDLSLLLANLLTTTDVLKTRTDGLEHSLSVMPWLGPIGHTLLPGDGTAHLGFIFNVANPMPCTRGYESTKARAGDETTDVPPNEEAYCAEPKGSPISVRGSQHAPFGGLPDRPREPGGP